MTCADGIYVISTASGARPQGVTSALHQPHGVTVTPDGTHAYVTDTERDEVVVLSTASLRTVGRIGVGPARRGTRRSPPTARAPTCPTPTRTPCRRSIPPAAAWPGRSRWARARAVAAQPHPHRDRAQPRGSHLGGLQRVELDGRDRPVNQHGACKSIEIALGRRAHGDRVRGLADPPTHNRGGGCVEARLPLPAEQRAERVGADVASGQHDADALALQRRPRRPAAPRTHRRRWARPPASSARTGSASPSTI